MSSPDLMKITGFMSLGIVSLYSLNKMFKPYYKQYVKSYKQEINKSYYQNKAIRIEQSIRSMECEYNKKLEETIAKFKPEKDKYDESWKKLINKSPLWDNYDDHRIFYKEFNEKLYAEHAKNAKIIGAKYNFNAEKLNELKQLHFENDPTKLCTAYDGCYRLENFKGFLKRFKILKES